MYLFSNASSLWFSALIYSNWEYEGMRNQNSQVLLGQADFWFPLKSRHFSRFQTSQWCYLNQIYALFVFLLLLFSGYRSMMINFALTTLKRELSLVWLSFVWACGNLDLLVGCLMTLFSMTTRLILWHIWPFLIERRRGFSQVFRVSSLVYIQRGLPFSCSFMWKNLGPNWEQRFLFSIKL